MKRLEKDNIIKDVKNCYTLKKEIDDNAVKDIKEIFRLKKINKAIKEKIIRDIKNILGHEEEEYYKAVRIGNFGVTITLNMKVTVIEIKHYQLEIILIKIDHA